MKKGRKSNQSPFGHIFVIRAQINQCAVCPSLYIVFHIYPKITTFAVLAYTAGPLIVWFMEPRKIMPFLRSQRTNKGYSMPFHSVSFSVHTGSSWLMRISLLLISFRRFFHTFLMYLANAILVNFISLLRFFGHKIAVIN